MDNNIKNNIDNVQNGASKKGSFNFKDVHVFTMPKGIKKLSVNKNSEADSAKKTGFIILVFGSLFLISLLAGSYYYFVVKSDKNNTSNTNMEGVQEQVKVVEPEVKTEEPEKTPKNKTENKNQAVNTEQKTEQENEDKNIDNNNSAEFIEEDIKEAKEEDTAPEKDIKKEEPVRLVVDNDNDGLSAEEEVALGTSDSSPDTDSDSYLDLAEMLNGYNPLGEGLISDNKNFKKIVNSQYNFLFYYPSIFKLSTESNDAIIIDLGNEEFIQLFIEENSKKYNIEDWYKNQFGVNLIDNNLITTRGDWSIVKNADSKSIFFKNNKSDYVIAFNYSSENEARYLNIFEIMFNTFETVN